MHIFTFITILILFLFVGFLASKQSNNNASDYILANRNVSSLLTALSAAASKYSGYMFIGLIGYIYTYGLSAIWIIVGFILGDLIAWLFVAHKISHITTQTSAISFASLLSRGDGEEYTQLKKLIAGISLLFLTVYAAAQLSAAGKTLYAIFDWSVDMGTTLGAVLVLAYCFKGGLRASIWTDALQAIIMLIALFLIAYQVLDITNGLQGFLQNLNTHTPAHLDWGIVRFGSIEAVCLFALGWIFNGIGTLGQPHIMVRLMALSPTANLKHTTVYYFTWSLSFVCLILFTGLSARLFIDPAAITDTELALPLLAQKILPEVTIGIVIAGIFASILSTADSQILSCATVLSEDFSLSKSQAARRIATLTMVSIALLIALFALSNVFNLVIFAWSALASGLAPLVIIMALDKRPSEKTAIFMLLIGFSAGLVWRYVGLNSIIYEAFSGITSGLIVYLVNHYYSLLRSSNTHKLKLNK
ncbi:sodium/proline symporter [Algibacillus agarilyticus]|uniref:sodium/proline symporter n=1 Tax=Algibacillus agarilyticus TaxID=2234133 RepID=UPI000DCF9296|nr:sodium/proline symporter [Algibacillus agarilyticus]